MVWKLKKSGTHVTMKNELPVARVLESVRPPQPQKGTGNPLHLQVNISKLFKRIGGTK